MKVSNLYHLLKNLQKIKKDRHLTTNQLAEGSGLSQTTISNWEKLKCQPTLLHLQKLADFLDVCIDALVNHKKGKFY